MLVERVAAPLRQQVLDSLRGSIVNGLYPSGTRLIERELCEKVGVSRTLIREAMRQLEAEGLIEVIPNQGPVVATIEAERARDIYEVRALLEAHASKLFATGANASGKAALRRKFDQIVRAHARNDFKDMLKRKTEFYKILLEGCGNAVVAEVLRQLTAQITLLRATALSQEGRTAGVLEKCEAILEAIEAGDGDAAWNNTVKHVENAADVTQALLANDKSAALVSRL